MHAISQWLCPLFLASVLLLAQAADAADNFSRQDITFTSVGQKLVGWLYLPKGIKEALIKFHMRDRGDSGRGQDGEDAV